MTPYEITILMHHYVSPTSWRGEGYRSPIYEETMSALLKLNLLSYDLVNDEYAAGPALPTYMEALLAVPAPVQAWVMP